MTTRAPHARGELAAVPEGRLGVTMRLYAPRARCSTDVVAAPGTPDPLRSDGPAGRSDRAVGMVRQQPG